ncbi:anthranilate synthase component I [Bacillus sp. NRRL B-14911]|uniref:Uncharacterized protein n=1 Tax=Bacillus infantis NRRL B-14911 TaxID=1367477 RepID=U5LE85_9BACI|nr:hypothetical protein N288_15635 [Bacillus infantis NRRL B-14911]EAR66544.1 anthranilate synthase component I [Bacillus sp. NRRL B-14911]OXT16427.1 hypothetical protein B9K06_16220 [Bacillus sp. OG2]PLR75068.1 hypothetical protein CYJ37_05525 [Bacillus sp. UMB0728]
MVEAGTNSIVNGLVRGILKKSRDARDSAVIRIGSAGLKVLRTRKERAFLALTRGGTAVRNIVLYMHNTCAYRGLFL